MKVVKFQARVDETKCNGDQLCQTVCPSGAIARQSAPMSGAGRPSTTTCPSTTGTMARTPGNSPSGPGVTAQERSLPAGLPAAGPARLGLPVVDEGPGAELDLGEGDRRREDVLPSEGDPEHRPGGLREGHRYCVTGGALEAPVELEGRDLPEQGAVVRDLEVDLDAVEAYGDRRAREWDCVLPATWLLHEGFEVAGEHPRLFFRRVGLAALRARATTPEGKAIVARLKALAPDIPIITEEASLPPFEERRHWRRFWLVDPLDGTKEFIKRNGEFTVNIALIHDHVPVLGDVLDDRLDRLVPRILAHRKFQETLGQVNEAFEKTTGSYMSGVRYAIRRLAFMMVLFVGALALTGLGFLKMPAGFVPVKYFIVNVIGVPVYQNSAQVKNNVVVHVVLD